MNATAFAALLLEVAAEQAEKAARAAWSACAPDSADKVWQASCARLQADNARRSASVEG